MNKKVINLFKNFSYTIISNALSVLSSLLVILILPKIIGIEEYGYWQLYLFYISYVAILHLGWSDGIYLRYGGKDYNELSKPLFFSQFYTMILFQVLIGKMILLISFNLFNDNHKIYIIQMSVLAMIITNVRSIPLFILQATNRIREYANSLIFGQLIYISMIAILIINHYSNFKLLIVSDLLGKLITLLYLIYICRDIVFRHINDFKINIKEIWINIRVGSKLVIAYIASLLIIGIVRFGIEQHWDISTFGKISLVLNISNMLMVFINAIGIILFPVLRKVDTNKLLLLYSTIRNILMPFLLGLLIFCYPIKVVLAMWLPQYADSLSYIMILFPIIIFEGKMALLINTFLKVIREETFMLKVNVFSLGLSLLTTIICIQLFDNLDLVVVSITMLIAIRSILSEIHLSKVMKSNITNDIVLETIVIFIFILLGWILNTWLISLIYLIVYFCYLSIKRKDIITSIKTLKKESQT